MPDRNKSTRILNGYVVVYRPNHPSSMTSDNWKGYIYEHILVAEKFLGRPLQGDEIVHHLDGDRGNNLQNNLLVLLRSQHLKIHEWINNGAKFKEKGASFKTAKSQLCLTCGEPTNSVRTSYCSPKCVGKAFTTPNKPSYNQLKKDLLTLSFVKVGKKYGVSDNAVRKWVKSYGGDPKAVKKNK